MGYIIGLSCICFAIAAVGLGYWLGARGLRERALLLAGTAFQSLGEDYNHAKAQWEVHERRAEEFRTLNSSVLAERNKWQQLYWSQVSGHGNAQAMMMAAIEHLSRRLQILGQKVELPPVIRATMDEFTERHVSTLPLKPGISQIPPDTPQPAQLADTTSTERAPVPES